MEVDKSVAQKNISIINAEGQYASSVYANNITAYMIKNTVTKQSEAYTKSKNDLKLDTPKNLLDYIYYLNIMSLDKSAEGAKLVIGVDNPRVTLQDSGKGYSFTPVATQ